MESNVGYLAAFLGGIVSFLSPCVLPLVPAYLSVVGGVSVGELRDGTTGVRARVLGHTLLFVGGFSVVFVLLGLSLTRFGRLLLQNESTLTVAAGAIVIGMALFLLMTQFLWSPRLQAEYRFHPQPSRFGALAAPIAGAAFAFGWTPCIGPVLTSVFAVASTHGETGRAAALLAVYSLGLGIPFLITGFAFERLTGAFDWFKRHGRTLNIVAAVALALFGSLLVTDQLAWVTSQVQKMLEQVGLGWLVTVG